MEGDYTAPDPHYAPATDQQYAPAPSDQQYAQPDEGMTLYVYINLEKASPAAAPSPPHAREAFLQPITHHSAGRCRRRGSEGHTGIALSRRAGQRGIGKKPGSEVRAWSHASCAQG